MIERSIAYKTANGVFNTIAEAQQSELSDLILSDKENENSGWVPEFILANKNAIIDILTMTPNSKPSARKINGGHKTRKKPDVAQAAKGDEAI